MTPFKYKLIWLAAGLALLMPVPVHGFSPSMPSDRDAWTRFGAVELFSGDPRLFHGVYDYYTGDEINPAEGNQSLFLIGGGSQAPYESAEGMAEGARFHGNLLSSRGVGVTKI